MSDDTSIRAVFLDFAKPAKVLSSSDRHVSAKLCEVGKAFLLQQVKHIVCSAGQHAVLLSYSSDGTPLKTHERYSQKIDDKLSVVRKGSSSQEYLCEKVFVRTVDSSGHVVTGVAFRDPLPLKHGKSSLAIFAAGRQFMPTLREMGHRAVAVSHYGFDRAVYSSLDQYFRQLHMHQHHPSSDHDLASPRHLEWLLDWVVTTGCCNHDAHNALKLSLMAQMQDTQLLKDLWISIESLRNAYEYASDSAGTVTKRVAHVRGLRPNRAIH
jgi:hypothetical protein